MLKAAGTAFVLNSGWLITGSGNQKWQERLCIATHFHKSQVAAVFGLGNQTDKGMRQKFGERHHHVCNRLSMQFATMRALALQHGTTNLWNAENHAVGKRARRHGVLVVQTTVDSCASCEVVMFQYDVGVSSPQNLQNLFSTSRCCGVQNVRKIPCRYQRWLWVCKKGIHRSVERSDFCRC